MTAWLRSQRVLAVLLALSVAVNLFLGGLLAGRFTGQAVADSQTRRSIQAMLAPLPQTQRDKVRQEIHAVMPQVRERTAALQQARARLAAEMVKPSIDSAALASAFAEVQTQTSAIGAELQQALVRAMPQLSLDERHAMVQALAQRQSSGALPLP